MKNIEFKYLQITETDKDFGLWVNTVGFQSIAPDSDYPPSTDILKDIILTARKEGC